MSLACTYQWSAVRAFHYKVLRILWSWVSRSGATPLTVSNSPFLSLRTFFRLMGSPSNEKAAEKAPEKARWGKQPMPSCLPAALTPPDLRRLVVASTTAATRRVAKLHICIICKRPDHQARHCPKRRFDIPTRRQDPSPPSS